MIIITRILESVTDTCNLKASTLLMTRFYKKHDKEEDIHLNMCSNFKVQTHKLGNKYY